MKKGLFFLLLAVNLFAINCGDFTGEFKTYNGHYYAITGNKMSFQTAKNFAQANNGYIAIPNDSGENNFIKGIVGTNNEAWIGIYDPNYTQSLCFTNNCYSTSRSRFKTVKGTSLAYQNWDNTDVENQFMKNDDTVDKMGNPIITTLGEHWTLMSGNTGKWRDWGTHFFTGENPAIQKAVIEFDAQPTCYSAPSNVTGEITGRVCNSQVWDSTVGLSDGTTAQCMTDANNIEYCPQALAECGQQWDYENGYSVSGVGIAVDYTDKIVTQLSQPASMVTTIPNPINLTITYANNDIYNTNLGYQILSVKGLTDCGDYFGICGGTTSSTKRFYKNGNVSVNREYQYGTYEITRKCDSETQEISIVNSIITVSVPKVGNAYYSATLNGTITGVDGYADCGDYYGLCGTSSRHVKFYKNGTVYVNEEYRYGTYYVHLQTNTTIYKCLYYTCPTNQDYLIDFTTGVCNATTSTCPGNYTPTTGSETSLGQCKTNQNYTYYNYICNTAGFTAINGGGNTGKTDPNNTVQNDLTASLNSSTPPTNNCRRQKFVCLANASRPCANVSGKMQCSPFPCMGNSDFENAGTVEGQNDKNNSGWSNDGSCAGKLYIFNGEDKRCRKDDKLFGLTGGGCCDKDKVFMGLVSCKDNEKILAKKRQNDLCHYVGSYCSKYLKLGFAKICIQNSESHCCFSSKLGRIIHEQGRPQIGIGWGSGDSPNCRGFTPDEFQKLDFSKLDFTEFAKDIQTKTTNFNNIGGFVQNKVQNFFQQ